MSDDFHLEPLPADADTGELLEALGPIEDRSPESQFCVFRSGRERFCLPVLDVEEVLEWPLVTKLPLGPAHLLDRKSTRLNSSHSQISYAVFCLKKKKTTALQQLSAYR